MASGSSVELAREELQAIGRRLVASYRRRIGYVFQDATLAPWRNVINNVGLLADLVVRTSRPARGSAPVTVSALPDSGVSG